MQTAYERVLTTTHFVDEELAPIETWCRAEKLVAAIDRHDVAFVVLTDYLQVGLPHQSTLYNKVLLVN